MGDGTQQRRLSSFAALFRLEKTRTEATTLNMAEEGELEVGVKKNHSHMKRGKRQGK